MRGVAVGDAGTIIMTENAGETWSIISNNEIHDNLRAVRIFEKETPAGRKGIDSIVAVGTHGAIYYSPNMLERREQLDGLLDQRTYRFDNEHTIKVLNDVISELRDAGHAAGNPILKGDIDHLLEIRTRIDQLVNVQKVWSDTPPNISTAIYRENTIWGMLLSFELPLMVFLTTLGISSMLLNIYRTNIKLAAFYNARADAVRATAAEKMDYDTFAKFAEVMSPGETDIAGDGGWLERIDDLTARIFGTGKRETPKA